MLVVLGVCAALGLVELAARIATDSLFSLAGPGSASYDVVDPVLGHVPKPGTSIHHPTKNFTVSIGEHGTRRNGDAPPRAERPLTLAVGDSFAFGDEVDDEDTWAAVLERISGRRVINAGVPGFGLDQAVLRAEQLAPIYAPDVILVSFIPHDVLRCQMSYWSGNAKPYFDIDSSGLRLRAAPTPEVPAYAPLKPLLATSAAVELFFPTFLHWEGPYEELVHDRGRDVACLLMDRLAALGRAHNARVVVLAQPQQATATAEHLELARGVLACAEASKLLVLDLFPVIERLSPEQRARLFHGHMSVEGNRVVGTELNRFLSRQVPSQSPAPERQVTAR